MPTARNTQVNQGNGGYADDLLDDFRCRLHF